ncbi:Hypothetical predicted protein [Paramuricea clavata]|uniref:Uncharacterized protein n=1 Tax=Paramuricea clavata TaxID=317549 RepID=A0A6S7JDA3_PARCT|nr:Hypothetical predicted protein [Paramuricea clavata]
MNIFLAHEWSEAAIAKFADLSSSDKELRMTVHEVKDKVLSVSLVDVSSELDIAEEMKKTGLAISTKIFKSTTSSSLVPSSEATSKRPSQRTQDYTCVAS